MVNDHTRSAENWKCVWYFLRPIDGSSACAKRCYTPINVAASVFRMDRVGSLPRRLRSLLLLFPMLQLHIVLNGPSGSLPRRLQSLLLLFPMLQLHSVSNGPSGEPATPTAEFIIVVSNVPASQCFEWTECREEISLYCAHICIHIHVIKQMITPKYLC